MSDLTDLLEAPAPGAGIEAGADFEVVQPGPEQMVTRRRIIIGFGLAAMTSPLAAYAQQRKVIGYLANNSEPRGVRTFQAFVAGLHELGWIEGKNLEIRIRTSEGKDGIFPALAAQLVHENVDVIVTTGAESTRAAKEATQTIPIVFGSTANPVELGLVNSLGRPGGNVTGMAFFSLELGPKRLQLLKEILPNATRIARLYAASNAYMAPAFARGPDTAARALNVTLEHIPVKEAADFDRALQAAADRRVQAVTVEQDAVFVRPASRERMANLALKHHLPMMGPDRRYAESGALIAYGENFEAMYRRAADFVNRILRGAKPADIPVEQPTVLEMVVNLKTAAALRIAVPKSIQLTADRVIQ
jgi:putative ABC transport system substrate-binding protein